MERTLKVIKDTPLMELTLRRYERPDSHNKRELLKKLCLSLGLLQPGDSRDIIVDVFYVLLESKELLSSEEIKEKAVMLRKQHNLALLGTASSNIRRQIKRLRDIMLAEKIKNSYRITENLSIKEIFTEKIEKYMLSAIVSRIKDYAEEADNAFSRKEEAKPEVMDINENSENKAERIRI